jgi:hypothetical protein
MMLNTVPMNMGPRLQQYSVTNMGHPQKNLPTQSQQDFLPFLDRFLVKGCPVGL